MIGDMKRHLLLIASMLLLLAGCRKDDPEEIIPDDTPEEDVVTASLEGGIQDRWLAGDRINVFSTSVPGGEYSFIGNGSFTKKNESGASAPSSLKANYAVYPYSESNSLNEDGTFNVVLPGTQPYLKNDISQHVNTMVAVTSGVKDSDFKFRNVCGWFMVKIYGNFVARSVTLSGNGGELISGPAKVRASNASVPSVTMGPDAGTEITIDCGSGVSLGFNTAEATSFWFAVPPVTFSEGITIKAEDFEGNVYTKVIKSPVKIARSTKGLPLDEQGLVLPEIVVKPLKFVSSGQTSLKLVKSGSPAEVPLEFSKDGRKWSSYEIGSSVSLSDGESVFFKAAAKSEGFSKDASNNYHFESSGPGTLAASGMLTSLVNSDDKSFSIPSEGCFHSLFKGMTNLTEGPTLPDGEVKKNCYAEIFSGCSSLTYLRAMFKTAPDASFTSGWLSGVAAEGIFVMNPDAAWKAGPECGVPEGWYIWDIPEDDDPVIYNSVDYLRPNPSMGSNHIQANQLNEDDPTEWTFYTTGTDPYIPVEGLKQDAPGPIFVFQYKLTSDQRFELFWCPGGYPNQLAGGRETPFMVEESADWNVCKVDMAESWEKFGWPGKVGDGVRFDIGGKADQTIIVRLMHWRARTPFD